MQRYFASFNNNEIVLSDGDVHHLLHVMRARKGDQIEAVIDGKCYVSTVDNISPLSISIAYEVPGDSEIGTDLTLFFALAKSDKIEFVIQKATELGAKRIVLIKSSRCVVKFSEDDFNRKLPRYQKIAKEAGEQCHRLVIPEILGVYDIRKIPDSLLADDNFVAYEKLSGTTEGSFDELAKGRSVSILIGSEGGISEEEINLLISRGFKTVSLGKRILRCETAAVYALSVMGFLLEK